ncbi:MAG: hypothetical protein ACRD4K_10250 [Candidatus Acidiferrales bacterium]
MPARQTPFTPSAVEGTAEGAVDRAAAVGFMEAGEAAATMEGA